MRKKETRLFLVLLLVFFSSLFFTFAQVINITNIRNTSINATKYEVSFNLTEESNASIFYGSSSGSYAYNISNSSYILFHNISISGLRVNTTYYYYILVGNSSGQSNETQETNFTTIFDDIVSPYWTNNISYPLSTFTYSPSQVYQFNTTWYDYNLTEVWIRHNFSGTKDNYWVANISETVFFYNITGIAAGKFVWRYYGRDGELNINNTPWFEFNVIKANSSLNLTLNFLSQNISVEKSNYTFINASVLIGQGNISLYLDGSFLNNSPNPQENITFSTTGLKNITVLYAATQNYTTSYKTYFINVTDITYPIITINNPINTSFFSDTSFLLNITTDEIATCIFSFGGSYNTSLTDNRTNHTITVQRQGGTYNLTVNCTDQASLMTSLTINFTIDTTSPVILVDYPSNNQIITDYNITFNYSVNDTYFDSMWYKVDYNQSSISLSPGNTLGGYNTQEINFSLPGKKSLTLYSNDTSGNEYSKTLDFYINKELNVTSWKNNLNTILSNVSSIQVFNSTFDVLSDNITMYHNYSLELNFTNSSLYAYNLTAINIIWSVDFRAEDNSSYFESLARTAVGKEPVDYVFLRNFSLFYNQTNYFGTVKLPRNMSYYDSIYYCGEDDLSDCSAVSPCSNINNYVSTTGSACYNSTTENVYVYVPHFSSVFGVNDTVYPSITLTSPVNGSNITTSSNLNLAFTVNEASTCRYSLNAGSYNSLSGTTSFSTLFNATENSYQNISINCTDAYDNSGLSLIYFRINDTTAPSLSTISEDSDNDSITLIFTTNELSNSSVLQLSNSATKTKTNYILSHTHTFSSLSSSTTYTFNITLCDRIGNCRSTSAQKATTGTSDDDSSASSTTTGSTTNPAVSTKVMQSWLSLSSGLVTMEIPSNKIAFTKITFTLLNSIDTAVTMTVENMTRPNFLPSIENKAYQYQRITKTGINDNNVENVVITFRIPNSWINNNNIDEDTISLYRYTNSWKKLTTSLTAIDSTYTYFQALSPGLSYFGVSGEEQEAVQTQNNNQDNTPTGNTVDNPSSNEDNNAQEPEDLEPVSMINFRPNTILIFLGLSFLIILSGVVVFMFYQKNVSFSSDDELTELRKYVKNCKAEGINNESIKQTLLKTGWDENIIELAIHEVHVPRQEIDKLVNYIKEMKKARKTNEEIKLNLRKVGWQDEAINEAFKQF